MKTAKIIEKALKDLKFTAAKEGLNVWKFKRGSASLAITLSEYFVSTESVIFQVPQQNREKLFRYLLEKNFMETLEAKFALQDDDISVVYNRSTDGLDKSEISRMIDVVSRLADKYDDLLIEKFGENQ